MIVNIGAQNVVVISGDAANIPGNEAAAFYVAFREKCGNPPEIRNDAQENGFLWQGFYVCYRPQK